METEKLENIANKIRQLVLISLLHAGSGHTAGSLGMADVFTYLYFDFLKVFPNDPWNEKRDRVFLSNGHIVPVWYATLAVRGYFPVKDLVSLRDVKSDLQGHPVRRSLPGIDNTSGSLGQGLSQAIGSAIALKSSNKRVVCLIGDGEMNEGIVWEALMYIGNSKLDNLTIVIDRNSIQQSGETENVMALEPLVEKLESFNLVTFSVDGHDFKDLSTTFKKVNVIDKPTVIIANTVPGKGVSFIENDYTWHAKAPSKEEARLAVKELKESI